MALSNLKIEPRREITEQLIGTAVLVFGLGGFGYADYRVVNWLNAMGLVSSPHTTDIIGNMVVVGILLPIAMVVLYLLLLAFIYGCHALGEQCCAGLARLGLDPRPKRRYKLHFDEIDGH